MKRVLSLILATIMLLSAPMELLASQVEVPVVETETVGAEVPVVETETEIVHQLPVGLMELEATEVVDESVMGEVYDYETLAKTNKYSDIYIHNWDVYASNYYYNQLDSEWKEFWDGLSALCAYYLDSTDTIGQYVGFVKLPEATSVEEMKSFVQIYLYSNPQYYFLKNGWSYYKNSEGLCTYISLKAYDAFLDGTARQTATTEIWTQIDAMLVQINAYTSDVDKVQKANELLCESVTYNNAVLSDNTITSEEEETYFTQSAYSTFCKGTTVCAGYAEAMSILCNGTGVDAVSVTSYNHQWNKVRVDDTWYNVDVTWTDQDREDNRNYYRYFFRSDAFYSSDNASHVEESFWSGISPAAIVDVVPTSPWSAPGTCPTVTDTAATPVITEDNGVINITSATDGAEIYFTLDGTNPGVSAQKAYRYVGPFEVTGKCEIKAMAACNTYFDSSISSYTSIPRYSITYELSGGTNNASNPSSYVEGDVISLANPTRTGYLFYGWYKDADFTNQISYISADMAEDLTLYAKWTAIQYPIVFDGNGADSGYMSKIIATYDIENTLPVNGFEKFDYKFLGWNTKADGSGTSYADKASVKNLTTTAGETVTLYAQWRELEKYSITYELNGGTNTTANPTTYTEGKGAAIYEATKTGYTFKGWYTDAAFTKQITEISADTTGDIKLYAKWEIRVWQISYIVEDDAVVPTDNPTTYTVETDTIVLKDATRNGYIFLGWYNQKSKEYVKQIEKGTAIDLRLVAKWEPIVYNINYELDGGTNNANNPSTYTVETQINTFKSPEKEGYNFLGWYKDAECTIPAGISKGTTGDITLYAHFTPITYFIIFDGNGADAGGVDSMGAPLLMMLYYDDEAVPLKENTYTREKYVFTGWNTEPDGSGTAYAEGTMVRNLTTENQDKIYLYAQWEREPYTIKYVLDGGTNHSDNPSIYRKESETIELQPATKEGYTFNGWYSNSKMTKRVTKIKKGSTGDIKLYAKWTENKYNIKFDDNGATSGSTSKLKNCYYDNSYKLTANGFKKSGYTFVGWNTEADGSGTSYADKKKVSKLSSKNGDTVTLYAQWERKEYAITYELNGGTDTTTNPSSYNVDTATFILQDPTREGYVFKGWYTDKECKKNKVTQIKTGTTGKKTLYAKWTINKYTIQFDGNGATSGSTKKMSSCAINKTYTLTQNGFKRTGYTFVGWSLTQNGEVVFKDKGKVKEALTRENDVTVTLYAQWEVKTYDITYKNGKNTENPATYTIESDTIILKDPVKKGYTFKGWYTDKSLKSQYKITEITAGSKGNLTLYAKWNANKYTITFDVNCDDEVTGKMADVTYTYKTTKKLSNNKYKRNGYKFVSWNTKADGTGTEISNKGDVKNLLPEDGETTITLYAQWKVK